MIIFRFSVCDNLIIKQSQKKKKILHVCLFIFFSEKKQQNFGRHKNIKGLSP